MVELGTKINCFLPVTGTVLQDSKRKEITKNKLIQLLEIFITASPSQNDFLFLVIEIKVRYSRIPHIIIKVESVINQTLT